jgi:hypothetical protein
MRLGLLPLVLCLTGIGMPCAPQAIDTRIFNLWKHSLSFPHHYTIEMRVFEGTPERSISKGKCKPVLDDLISKLALSLERSRENLSELRGDLLSIGGCGKNDHWNAKIITERSGLKVSTKIYINPSDKDPYIKYIYDGANFIYQNNKNKQIDIYKGRKSVVMNEMNSCYFVPKLSDKDQANMKFFRQEKTQHYELRSPEGVAVCEYDSQTGIVWSYWGEDTMHQAERIVKQFGSMKINNYSLPRLFTDTNYRGGALESFRAVIIDNVTIMKEEITNKFICGADIGFQILDYRKNPNVPRQGTLRHRIENVLEYKESDFLGYPSPSITWKIQSSPSGAGR